MGDHNSNNSNVIYFFNSLPDKFLSFVFVLFCFFVFSLLLLTWQLIHSFSFTQRKCSFFLVLLSNGRRPSPSISLPLPRYLYLLSIISHCVWPSLPSRFPPLCLRLPAMYLPPIIVIFPSSAGYCSFLNRIWQDPYLLQLPHWACSSFLLVSKTLISITWPTEQTPLPVSFQPRTTGLFLYFYFSSVIIAIKFSILNQDNIYTSFTRCPSQILQVLKCNLLVDSSRTLSRRSYS